MNDLDLVILSQQYILEIFKNLHRISIKSEYSMNNDDISIIDDIIKIYIGLKLLFLELHLVVWFRNMQKSLPSKLKLNFRIM